MRMQWECAWDAPVNIPQVYTFLLSNKKLIMWFPCTILTVYHSGHNMISLPEAYVASVEHTLIYVVTTLYHASMEELMLMVYIKQGFLIAIYISAIIGLFLLRS